MILKLNQRFSASQNQRRINNHCHRVRHLAVNDPTQENIIISSRMYDIKT